MEYWLILSLTMLVIKDIDTVVLHNYKCAGTSIIKAIIDTYPDIRWNCHHVHINALPDIYKDFRRIGFCRNPISWYNSYYWYFKKSAKFGGSFLEPMSIVSDNFKLSFEKTLERVLDLKNFFDMNPDYIIKYQKQIQLDHKKGRCSSLMSFSDPYSISVNYFENTLYKHNYIKLGLDTAIVYKMDDGNLQQYLESEFPNTELHVLNKSSYSTSISTNLKNKIAESDSYYMNHHNYDVKDKYE